MKHQNRQPLGEPWVYNWYLKVPQETNLFHKQLAQHSEIYIQVLTFARLQRLVAATWSKAVNWRYWNRDLVTVYVSVEAGEKNTKAELWKKGGCICCFWTERTLFRSNLQCSPEIVAKQVQTTESRAWAVCCRGKDIESASFHAKIFYPIGMVANATSSAHFEQLCVDSSLASSVTRMHSLVFTTIFSCKCVGWRGLEEKLIKSVQFRQSWWWRSFRSVLAPASTSKTWRPASQRSFASATHLQQKASSRTVDTFETCWHKEKQPILLENPCWPICAVLYSRNEC